MAYSIENWLLFLCYKYLIIAESSGFFLKILKAFTDDEGNCNVPKD
jgi:hypothetical protein